MKISSSIQSIEIYLVIGKRPNLETTGHYFCDALLPDLGCLLRFGKKHV
jgi:hypothetical protein